ncbi:hypothetical protein [Glycomyces sp. NPDC047010]|uniref:hypothetical protein n=1 Tax=Glycomyces sp. NPDC047010 TaxID=3155023 RepID=UPI0033DFBDAC
MVTAQRLRVNDGKGNRSAPEILGSWLTGRGNKLTVMARRGTGYASVWLDYQGTPVKIGYAVHAGGVVREVRWEEPWREQTDAWKSQQRSQIAALVAAWHAERPEPQEPEPLPASVVGTFEVDGFRFAVEPITAAEHVVLCLVSAMNELTPIADLLHEGGRICGMVTRPGWKAAPEARRRRWRAEVESILLRAAERGAL